jgi:hypothetical protein
MMGTDERFGESDPADLSQVIVLVGEDADLDEVVPALERAGLHEARVYPLTMLVVGAAPLTTLPDLRSVAGVLSVEPERRVDAVDGDDQ